MAAILLYLAIKPEIIELKFLDHKGIFFPVPHLIYVNNLLADKKR